VEISDRRFGLLLRENNNNNIFFGAYRYRVDRDALLNDAPATTTPAFARTAETINAALLERGHVIVVRIIVATLDLRHRTDQHPGG
jgi:hypothetical protein